MKRMHGSLSLSSLPLLCLLIACGGGERTGTDDAPTPDATVPAGPAVLEGEDLDGIEERYVSFNLHWAGGPVNRDPSPDSDPVALQEVTTRATTTFDRIIFRFEDGAFPGYDLAWTDEAPADCANGQAVTVTGGRYLTLRLRPVTAAAAVARALQPGYVNLKGLAPTCNRDGELLWHIGVQDAAELRVIEMREPRRLVVDVRHPGTHGH